MYHLVIITPDHVVFDDEVVSLIAPGKMGYFEILAHHAPMIAALQVGKLNVTDKNGDKLVFAVAEGFLKVARNKCILIVDGAEPSSETDFAKAQAALAIARSKVESLDEDIEMIRSMANLHK